MILKILGLLLLATAADQKLNQKPYRRRSLTLSKLVCLNGNDPSVLPKKQILKEFAKGPCAPVALVPPFTGSRLLVNINCRVLRAKQPELFKLCGWNACRKGYFEFWKHVPRRQYKLWMSSFFGPLSIFQFSAKKNMCWSNLIKLAIDFTKPIERSVIRHKGFTVKVIGDEGQYKSPTECGNRALYDMPGSSPFSIKRAKGMRLLVNMLNEMGHVPGLTYQALPYDFRLSIVNNNFKRVFKPNIERLHRLTGKKVVLLGDSYGNRNIYHQLREMDQQFKDEHIKLWLSIGSSLLGSTQVAGAALFGDSSLIFFNNRLGLHYNAQIEAFNNMLSFHEQMPVDPFIAFKDADWMRAIEKRGRYENGELPYEESGFSFLPRKEEKCSPKSLEGFSSQCRLGLAKNAGDPFISILDDKYEMSQLKEAFSKYKTTANLANMFEHTQKTRSTDLENPGVPYVTLLHRLVPTPVSFSFKDDPRNYLKLERYPEYETTTGYGDGSVTALSQLVPALKWSIEFDKGAENARPVKIIDFCSTYNIKYDIYDEVIGPEGGHLKKNEFMGIYCECINKPSASQCTHQNIVQDAEVLKLVAQTIQDKSYSYSEHYSAYVDSLNDGYLETITGSCPQLFSNSTEGPNAVFLQSFGDNITI